MNIRSWFALVIMVLVTFVGTWNLLIFAPLQPFIAFDLGVSIGEAAQLTTASAGFAVMTLVVFGLFGSRASMRHLIWVGLISMVVGSLLLTTTKDYTLLLLIRFFNGAADGLIYPAAWVALGHYLPKEKQDTWGIAAIIAGTGVASFVGLPLTAWFLNDHSWQFAVTIMAMVGSGVFLISLTLPPTPRLVYKEKLGGFSTILGDRNLFLLLLANIFGAASWFGALAFVGSFIVQTYSPSLNDLAWFFVIAGGLFTVTVVATGVLAVTPKLQKAASIGSSILVVPMTMVFFGITEGFWLTAGLAAAFAVFRAPGVTSLESLLFAASEKTTARVPAIAALDSPTYLGTMGAAAIGGIVLSQSTYFGIGVIFAASAALSLAFLLMYRTDAVASEEPRKTVEEKVAT
ncbi:MAG: MFS transporter [Candidatus Woykebacteria bacterium]